MLGENSHAFKAGTVNTGLLNPHLQLQKRGCFKPHKSKRWDGIIINQTRDNLSA